MLMPILIGFVIVASLLLAFIATRPPSFRVARSIDIAAPAEIPFGLVNDFHDWRQ
jgi:hypothetical protein